MPNNQRARQLLVIVATAGVIFINYLAGTGRINGATPADVSDKFPTLITPSDYAFSIWSLIYLGLIAFAVYQSLPVNTERFAKIRTLYILNCAANCAWIYLWSYEQIAASLAAIFVMLGTLVFINANLLRTELTIETRIARVTFGVYFAWITVATILNVTVALIYAGVETSDSTASVSACALLIGATIIGVIMREAFKNAAIPLTVAWALTAIAVRQSGKTIIVAAAALGVAALLISAMSGIIRTKNQPQ